MESLPQPTWRTTDLYCSFCGKPYPMVDYVSASGTRISYPDTGNCQCEGRAAAMEEAKRVREAREAEDARMARYGRIELAGIPTRYRDVPPDHGRLDMVRGDTGLYIVGEVGRGKTHMACGIAIAAVDSGIGVRFTTMPELLMRIRATFNGKGGSEGDIIGEYASHRLLVIDDLGKGVQTDWTIEELSLLLNMRYNNALPTVFTTQYKRSALVARLASKGGVETAEAIVSRLKETTRTIVLDGPDRRIANG